MAQGIRDKVAILGMGCSVFGEHWDKDAEDLIVDAFLEGNRRRRHRAEANRRRLVRNGHRRAACRKIRRAARHSPAAAVHSRHARGELLRERHRGLSRRRLCCGELERPISRLRSASRS